MTRLIDADALKIALYYDVSKGTYGEFMDGSEVSFTNKEILKLIDEQPTVDLRKVTQDYASNTTIDAVPIEFIEKRIAELKKLNEYEFIANGGYTSPSDYEQWELERLIRDWREQNG